MAATVLAYLHAWDVLRMMDHQQLVSRLSPYLLVPATNAANGIHPEPARAENNPSGPTPNLSGTAGNGRPVTRKDSIPKAIGIHASPAVRQEKGRTEKPVPPHADLADVVVIPELPQQYGDGTSVDDQNRTEVQTFQQYLAEKKVAPASKAVLLDYYRQRGQNLAVSAT